MSQWYDENGDEGPWNVQNLGGTSLTHADEADMIRIGLKCPW